MNKKLFLLLVFGSVILISCKAIHYKTQTEKSLPELGSLGVFENYVAKEITQEKSVIELSIPIRLKASEVLETKRELFVKKDTENLPKEYITIEVLDAISLLEQINENKTLFGYLKSNPKMRIVSKIAVDFSKAINQEIVNSQELYLVQNMQKTLSLELRNDNKTTKIIEFSEGTILDFEPSKFCWGTKKGFKVQLLDMVDLDYHCGDDLYTSYKKAKKKTEISF